MSESFHIAHHRHLIETHANTIAPKFEYNNETLNDRWIVEYIFPNRRNGYFVEAGAANGRAASSCYVLEAELGWTGICIEPNESFFQKLTENRPHSICENVCLADQPGTVTFVQGDGLYSSYLSGIKTNLERFKYGSAGILQEGAVLEKEAVTLVSLLEKHNAPHVIEYGAFDIEGSELDVLRNFPFDRYRFLALTMECDEPVWEQLLPILARYGYRQVSNPFNQTMPWEKYCLHESVEW